MGIQEAVLICLANYAGFQGRAARPEFWWWVLFVVASWIILYVMAGVILGADSGAGAVAGGLFCLAALLPGLAVGARRLHDTDRSGWWLLLLLLPIAGWLVLIYFFVEPTTPGPNLYGDGLGLF